MAMSHQDNFKTLLNAASGLSGTPAKVLNERVHQKLLPAIEKQVAATRGPVKKLYESAYNTFVSIADGVKTGEVSKADYQEFLKELSGFVDRAKDLENAPPKSQERSMDSDAWLMQQAQRGAAVLNKYKPYETMLPRTLAKRFLAKRMPVIALTNPILSSEKLESFRILGDVFFGYPIIKNQVVLGLSADWVTSEYNRDFDEAIKDISEILFHQTNKRYLVLGSPRKRGLVYWAWLVTEADMQRLNKSAFSGHFQLKAWSFPFEAGEIITPTEQKQALIREAKDKYPSLRD